MFSDYTPPAPTPRELRRRLASAKKQLLKLRALRQRARQVAIDIVKGLGLRVRCARRPPDFLYDVFRCSPIWEADDRCKLTFIYPAPPRQWQAELKRLRSSGSNLGKSTSRPQNFFVCYFSPPIGSCSPPVFRWVDLPMGRPSRWVALPMGRSSDGSLFRWVALSASQSGPLNVRWRMRLGRHC